MKRRLALAGAIALSSCGSSTVPPRIEDAASRPYRDLPDVPRRTVVELPSQYEIPARLATARDLQRVTVRQTGRNAAPAGRTPPPTPTGGAAPLACIRSHESDSSGGYRAVSPTGRFRGAYQFDQATWDGAVARAGYPDYSGTHADEAPVDVQDAAARQLYAERALQPWPPARNCA